MVESLNKHTSLKGFSFTPESILGERSVPLGFDAKGDTLYYASNVGRDTFGLYAVNLLTGEHLADLVERSGQDLLSPRLGTYDAAQYFGFERTQGDIFDARNGHWGASPQLVFDRFTRELAGLRYEADTRTAIWLRPELKAVQQQLAAARPGRSAEIMEWDESLNRILVREQGPAEPGSFYLLDRAAGTYRELTRRGADPDSGSVARLTPFAFALPDGSKIDGLLALPKESKLKRIPLVLLCPDLPWHRRGASYLPEFEALTRMGLAVAIYNGRGAWGTGIKERRKLAVNPDEVQAADLVAVADYLAEHHGVSRKRVALVGRAHGGYAALRTLQLYPGRFRCAVTREAWIRQSGLFEAVLKGQPLTKAEDGFVPVLTTPVSEHPELINVPVFTLASRTDRQAFHANARLHAAVKDRAPDSELLEISEHTGDTPKELAKQWARIESFLNFVLYDYRVDLGDLEILPDRPEAGKRP